MDERVQRLKTPKDCEVFAKNATRLGRPDLALEAQRRSVELRAEKQTATTGAEREALKAVYAYEEVLAKTKGKRIRANRTWQMIRRHGIIPAVERAVNRSTEAAGYRALAEMKMQDLAFESVVLRYPNLFSSETVERAQERISEWSSED
ncbi:MAG: hypothetical protein HYY48_05515 [Gammaproteobacteria bacterium]|nr:hypothetical protein [Gammaproteobacteria bacterium]